MKKTSFLATYILVLLLTVVLINGCRVYNNKYDYLGKVIENLDKIKSATYSSIVSASAPGDTLQFKTYNRNTEEYINPSDKYFGSSFIEIQYDYANKVSWIYDGRAYTFLDWNEKTIEVDSFKNNTLPYRPVSAPFFNYTESILKYALKTKDTISTDLKDFGDSIKFSLYIPNKVLEFFGKPVVTHDPSLSSKDEFSRYDIWINKSNNLPYRYRRNMPHQTSWQTCKNVKLNNNKIEDFTALKYIPSDFIIATQKTIKTDLVGKKAPDWLLKDVNNNTFALKDLESKVILIQFSGIGCGPCHMSIPFLKQLVDEYENKDFEFVSIETWSDNIEGIKRYQKNNALDYMFLISNKQVKNDYQVKEVPAFYILDKYRVIRKIIIGYGKGTTDKEIKDAIDGLI